MGVLVYTSDSYAFHAAASSPSKIEEASPEAGLGKVLGRSCSIDSVGMAAGWIFDVAVVGWKAVATEATIDDWACRLKAPPIRIHEKIKAIESFIKLELAI